MKKKLLIGCGSTILAVIAVIAGLFLWLWTFSMPNAPEMTDYHPFRSREAKAESLQRYDEAAKDWPIVSQTMFVGTSYGKTFVRISGPLEAPPLILLHGAGANSLMWMPNIIDLSRSYRVYAVDNIVDYGRSVNTRNIEHPDDFVVWLDETFTALKLDRRFHLVGMSYGGWLAGQYSLRFPERLKKVVLLAPGGTVLPFRAEFKVRAALSFIPHRYFINNFFFWLFEDLVNTDEAARQMVREWVDGYYFNRQSFQPRPLIPPTVFEDQELQKISIPVLFMVGENEKIYSAKQAVDRLHTIAPNIETAIIPKAGHDIWIVQAKTVNDHILDFLNKP